MKTLCITGGNGLLGTKILQAASGSYRLVSIDLDEQPVSPMDGLEYVQADVTDRTRIREVLLVNRPDCVVHTAAITHVDRCETEQEKAWSVNVEGTENVARACRALGAKMIHLSSDYVFDGESGPYGEEDETHPLSFYGKTKLEGEKIVSAVLEDFVIARTIILYGFSPGIRLNFATWLIDRLSAGEKVRIVTDQYGTPTLADDLAAALLTLWAKDGRGLFHAAGREWIHRYDFALRIAEVFELDASLIQETTSGALDQPAPRPLRSGLKIDKFFRETGGRFSSASEGLLVMKKQMQQSGDFT